MNSKLYGWAGIAAMLSGFCYTIVGIFHPLNVLASVSTPAWMWVHVFAMGMSIFGVYGVTGLYVRQAEKVGWLGLIGAKLLNGWMLILLGFTFVEVFILPSLVSVSPAFVESWLSLFNGTAATIDLGVLPLVWLLTGPVYILGGLCFGIATYRAAIFPRWAGILLAVGCVIGPIVILFPAEYQPKVAIPVGLALIWLGYALWSERIQESK